MILIDHTSSYMHINAFCNWEGIFHFNTFVMKIVKHHEWPKILCKDHIQQKTVNRIKTQTLEYPYL